MRKDPNTEVDKKIQELRSLVQEANGILKEAKQVRKEARELSSAKVKEAIENAVNVKINELEAHLKKQMLHTSIETQDHFTKMTQDFLTQGMMQTKGCPTIQEMFNSVSTLYHYANLKNVDRSKRLDITAHDMGPTKGVPGNLRNFQVEADPRD